MFGYGIKRLRKLRGITQEELAKGLGISRQAVCMWERERREITAKMLSRIARFFCVSLDELMRTERIKNPGKEEMKMGRTATAVKRADKKVKFELIAPEAKKVMLAGDFNSWDENSVALKREKKGLWRTDLSLRPGRYEYKFIVDGEWWIDPANSYTVTNAYGNLNSVKEI